MTTKVPTGTPDEAVRLYSLVEQSGEELRSVMDRPPYTQYDLAISLAHKKFLDACDAYHRYLKQQN